MVHGYGYAVGSTETGPRGANDLAAPNMLMGTYDRTLTSSQNLTAQLMLTAEKWSLPQAGYPELLQVGEAHSDGEPYIDYQHPHSSPIMEVSLADTIQLGDSDHTLRLSFAPRGPSSDGPEPFMHRETGSAYNPDAPLGHHIGQDVGHISNTVATMAIGIHSETFEISGFNGDEPSPTKVDLPMGPINSVAFRWTHVFSENWKAMASWADLQANDEHGEGVMKRTSASVYWDREFETWHIYDTFIFGKLEMNAMNRAQLSFLDEFVFQHLHHAFWGRVEYLQRLPEELALASTVGNQDHPRWVGALTLGFTQRVCDLEDAELRVGVSGTLDYVPRDFEPDYGAVPMTARIFLQLTGMKMWHL